jgi:hypothetical protein
MGNNSLRQAADRAIREKDGDQAAFLYDKLVDEVRLLVGDGQKEIAAELSRLAKEIESEGRVEEAFEFKQRTCALLLKLSMSARGRQAPPPVPIAAPVSAATVSKMRFEHLAAGCSDFDQELSLYLEAFKARQSWSFGAPGQRAASLNFGSGPLLLLYESLEPGWCPVFSVEDLAESTARLEPLGWKRNEQLPAPGGMISILTGPNGEPIALLQRTF